MAESADKNEVDAILSVRSNAMTFLSAAFNRFYIYRYV